MDIDKEAFWSKVDIKDTAKECWNWLGAKKPKGYGNLRANKQYLLAHRVSFELENGPIPNGFIVCHTCDNPSCCNPSHLMLGTTKSNSIDMLIKNRQKDKKYAAKGSRNGMSKLNEEKVLAIRSEYKSGSKNQYELAEHYGVTQPAIGSILRNETWRHVNG